MIVGMGDRKPPLSELAHYGVKGMKWGVRKGDQPSNTKYTDGMRTSDRRRHGRRAVSRINRRMNDGFTREQALGREELRDSRQRLAIIGATVAVNVLLKHGVARLSDIRPDNATSAIGANAAGFNYIRRNRAGVYKITKMK